MILPVETAYEWSGVIPHRHKACIDIIRRNIRAKAVHYYIVIAKIMYHCLKLRDIGYLIRIAY